mgnify:CR=1 FL=1
MRDGIEEYPKAILKNKAEAYFKTKFSNNQVEFYEKRNGVQLGSIAQLQVNSMKQRFFIKTHRSGHKTNGSSQHNR